MCDVEQTVHAFLSNRSIGSHNVRSRGGGGGGVPIEAIGVTVLELHKIW